MSAIPTLGIPELAGVTTYAAAARVGFSVEENVRRLLRFYWVERRLMLAAVAHIPATPEWEVKCALSWRCAIPLHGWTWRLTRRSMPSSRSCCAPPGPSSCSPDSTASRTRPSPMPIERISRRPTRWPITPRSAFFARLSPTKRRSWPGARGPSTRASA
jgi:hypothetical protein